MDIGKLDGPCREKYWEEMGETEKFELLREVIVHQDERITQLLNRLSKIERHMHQPNGEMVLAFSNHGGPEIEGSWRVRRLLKQK